MTVDRPNYRLSDAERKEALDALAEHVRTRRLDVVEYDERSAVVSAAKTRRELEPVFSDLPEPRPSVLAAPTRYERDGAVRSQRRRGLSITVAVIVGCALFLLLPRLGLLGLLLPVLIAVVVGTIISGRLR
ncbi:DUF1707 SHOCT-like domain-containing protein [Saccharomonospora viridis]|uniref:DUF1707 SHOCT-like domain-containing protein n=1 Tax=Saccharomonospora viridis TaxID=1852 RepID=UPI0023F29721|nr:DUF1707 domain-containing protein [Saccharomonospora viridis]